MSKKPAPKPEPEKKKRGNPKIGQQRKIDARLEKIGRHLMKI